MSSLHADEHTCPVHGDVSTYPPTREGFARAVHAEMKKMGIDTGNYAIHITEGWESIGIQLTLNSNVHSLFARNALLARLEEIRPIAIQVDLQVNLV